MYSKGERKVIKRLNKTTDEHRLLLFNLAAMPFFLDENQLYYSSLDALDIYAYETDDSDPQLVSEIKSETFRVKDSDISLRENRQKHIEYANENSQVLNIFSDNGNLYVMTLEGESRIANGQYDTADKFFSVYNVFRKNNHIASYTYDSIDTELLFDSTSDGLYFMKHTIENGEDVYTLNKLVIN